MTEQPGSNPNQPSSSPWLDLKNNVYTIAIAIALAVVLRLFIAEPRYIPSASMAPTLNEGDRLVIEKVSPHLHSLQKGDVIVFKTPYQLQLQGYKPNQAFIKRIIAMAGQTVTVEQGQVFVDGHALEENYIAAPPNYNLMPVTVPAHKLFVMGDNRNNSNDSHIWGFLPEDNVIGKAVFRFWPLNKLGGIA
jgi:signal peptidase I